MSEKTEVADMDVDDMNVEMHHYVECGLPNVWLSSGYETVQSPYGEGVSIRDIKGLHRCLGCALCDKPELLTGAEFRYLRRELDFSQKLMGELVGLGVRQIRNIERGAEVKEPYNRLIRHMYMAGIDPRNSYIELFKRLRSLDIEWHEKLTLSKANDDQGWSSNLGKVA